MQASALIIQLGGVSTLIGSVYVPPGLPLASQELSLLTSFHPSFLLGVALNGKHPCWNSSLTTRLGAMFFQHALDHNYIFLGPLQPTHYPYSINGRPKVLDTFTVKSAVQFDSTLAELNSDHSPVLLTLNTTIYVARSLSFSGPITNWAYFSDCLKLCSFLMDPLLTDDAVNLAVDSLPSTLSSVYDNSTTCCRSRFSDLFPEFQPLLQRKRTVRRRWRSFRTRAGKQLLNVLTNRVHLLTRSHKTRSFTTAV